MCFNTTFVTVLCILHFPGSAYMPVSIQLLLLFYTGGIRLQQSQVTFQYNFCYCSMIITLFLSVNRCVSIQLLLLFYKDGLVEKEITN